MKTPFQFSLEALRTLREADRRDVDIRILRLDNKLRRAKENIVRRQKRIEETGQRIRTATENLRSQPGVRVTGEEIRERSRVLAELRQHLVEQQRNALRKRDVVRLFQGQLRAQEELRKELQAEIDELERVREDELRKFKRARGRAEERERDEDQILRQNRKDDV